MRPIHFLPTRSKKTIEHFVGEFSRFAFDGHQYYVSLLFQLQLFFYHHILHLISHARIEYSVHPPSGHQSASTGRSPSFAYGASVKVFQFAAPMTLLPISVSTTLNHRLVGSFLQARTCRSRRLMKPAGDSSCRKSRKKVFRGVR